MPGSGTAEYKDGIRVFHCKREKTASFNKMIRRRYFDHRYAFPVF
jgi:hypothetical protein